MVAASTAGGRSWRPAEWKPAGPWEGEDGWSEYHETWLGKYGPIIGIVGFFALVLIGLATVVSWIIELVT